MKRIIRSSTNVMYYSDILTNLKHLDEKLRENEMFGEIDIYGGAVMCLGLNARESTHDIDAVFSPKVDMRKLIDQVAEENNLPQDWLNDGIKGFISSKGEFYRFGEDLFTNLTVFMTTPEYLLAMKCLSCRLGESSDAEDIRFLIDYLNLKDVDSVIKIILKYYPEDRLLPKTYYMLQEMFQ